MKNERTLKLIDEFICEKEKGKNIADMAKERKLSVTTIYKVVIPEVSKNTGISKDELLFFPGRGNPYGKYGKNSDAPIDTKLFWKDYSDGIMKVKGIIEAAEIVIEQ